MPFPGSRDWYVPAPDTWVDGHDWIAEAPQHVPDPFQSTLPLPMHWEDGSQSVDSVSLISSIQPSPTLLGSAPIVAPSAPDQAGEQPLSLEHRHFTPGFTAPLPDTLIWPTNERMPLGRNPDEHSGVTDSPIIHHAYGASVGSSSERFNINYSSHEVREHRPMTGTNPDTRGRQTVRRRTINTRSIISLPLSFYILYISNICIGI